MDEPNVSPKPESAAPTSAAAALAAPAPATQAPKRRHRWIWVVVGVFALLIACCGTTTALGTFALSGMDGEASFPSVARVAVIYLTAPIAGVGDTSLLGGAIVSPERIIDQLRRADKDPTVKAILLRIDSPGGTASASEEIAQAVAVARKPVIASIGDIGASGAYMVASQSREIWSTGASDVGSIGVIMQLTEYGELLAKIGVKQFAITSGKYKAAGAPWAELTPKEREMFQADADMVYEQFIALVAKGRRMPVARVRALATGWAWPGQRAKELGLVDHLGNYTDALMAAGKAGGIEGYPATVDYGRSTVLDVLSNLSGASSLLPAPSGALSAPGLTTVPVPR